MKLEEQITSLELAMKLYVLGVNQESLFYYQNEPYNNGEDDIEIKTREENHFSNHNDFNKMHPKYSAFTVPELLELIPSIFYKDETLELYSLVDEVNRPVTHIIPHRYHISVDKMPLMETHWSCSAIGYGFDNFGQQICSMSFGEHDKNCANACAKMLIHLIENGIINNDK